MFFCLSQPPRLPPAILLTLLSVMCLVHYSLCFFLYFHSNDSLKRSMLLVFFFEILQIHVVSVLIRSSKKATTSKVKELLYGIVAFSLMLIQATDRK